MGNHTSAASVYTRSHPCPVAAFGVERPPIGAMGCGSSTVAVQGEVDMEGKARNGIVNLDVGKTDQVFKIILKCNSLQHLPPELQKFVFLTELDVSQNALTTLPPSLLSLERLSLLDISENKLKELPADIGKLSALKQIEG